MLPRVGERGKDMRMPHIPLGDWTRDEDTAKTIIEERLNQEMSVKKPWEKTLIKLLTILCVIALIIYAFWDLLLN